MALNLENVAVVHDDFRLTAGWQAAAGERIAIIGPSGAGKSTLLMAIAGFVAVQGRILWNGANLTELPAGSRPISTLFQDQNLFPHLTLAQNLGLGLSPKLRLTGDEQDRIEQTLTRVGLSGMGDRKPAQISGGQQGRAALARALLRARPILLLDEPFAALGPALKHEMLDLVAELAGEALVLMVTHDPNDAKRIAGRTVLLADGVAHPPQKTEALFAHPPKALADYLGT